MAPRKRKKGVLGVTITRGDVSAEDWSTIHKFAVALERGRFSEYIELLQNPKKLLWNSFISGVGKGFGAIIGATVVVALLLAVMAFLAKVLPDPVAQPIKDTGEKIEQGVSQ